MFISDQCGQNTECGINTFNRAGYFVVMIFTIMICIAACTKQYNLLYTLNVPYTQIPLCELRNDGRDNLLVALIIAGEYIIPEVYLIHKNVTPNRLIHYLNSHNYYSYYVCM